MRQVLDGFVFITIAGIVCVFIVPQAIDAGGPVAIVFAILGLGFPVAVERIFDAALHKAHVFILILAALGLIVHATLDGIALLPLGPTDIEYLTPSGGLFGSLFDNQLALGVILHRLPVGMAIWWSVRTSFGVPVALATFAAISLATSVAYLQGHQVVELAAAPSLAYFQAFVSGSLVHVVAFGVSHDHHGHAAPVKPAEKAWAYRVGILLGMFVVFTAPHLHT